MVHVQEVVIDCADPAGLATFWAQVLQSRWGLVNEDWAVVDAKPVLICFQRVPEPKSSPKNRLHLDIQVPDAAAAVAHAERLGALPTRIQRAGRGRQRLHGAARPGGQRVLLRRRRGRALGRHPAPGTGVLTRPASDAYPRRPRWRESAQLAAE